LIHWHIRNNYLQAVDFLHRSYKKELLDRTDIPFDDIRRNMEELDFINTWLGGHRITIAGLKKILEPHEFTADVSGYFSICEIGCGDGNNLRIIKNFCENKNIPVRLTGIDINPSCIDYALSKKENADMSFIASDYRLVRFDLKPDIVFSSLFCHHFTNEEMIPVLDWMNTSSRLGFFINDLHRNRMAYYSIKMLTALFSKSYLVKNDAPLSVLRGFKQNELEMLIKLSGITNFSLEWKWAFRWLLTVNHTTRGR
jgi:SAM-dependent methyltransferase